MHETCSVAVFTDTHLIEQKVTYMKIFHTIKSIFALTFAGFVVVVLASCSSSTDSTGSGTGRVSLLLTDAPTDTFDQINVTLESISFLCEDDSDDTDDEVNALDDGLDGDDDDQSCNEVVLFEETRVINLLALQSFSELLSTTTIAAGEYSKIRLHVSRVELVWLGTDGEADRSEDAKLSSNKIDLNPRGSFNVTDGSHLIIQLDMDAEKSILVVEAGKSTKYIFRPVVFVSIEGEEDLKLVILDGKVLAKTDTGFQLCKVEDTEVNEECSAISTSANTVVQDALLNIVEPPESFENDNIVTILVKPGNGKFAALHIVITPDTRETLNLALFTGEATSAVDVDHFGMKTNEDTAPVNAGTLLAVALVDSTRIFDEYGNEDIARDKIVDGSGIVTYGLAKPDLSTIGDVGVDGKVEAAFVVYDNDGVDEDDTKILGIIVEIIDTVMTVEVDNGSSTTFECVDVVDADIFLLTISGTKIVQEEIAASKLQVGMSVGIYGDNEGESCLSADVVLATEIATTTI